MKPGASNMTLGCVIINCLALAFEIKMGNLHIYSNFAVW